MKYFTALVDTTLSDGTHHFTEIEYLVKRKKDTFAGKVGWTYTIKEGYAYPLSDIAHNKPVHVFCEGTYRDAIRIAFDKGIGALKNTNLTNLREITI